mgnify:CR=1 FL=1
MATNCNLVSSFLEIFNAFAASDEIAASPLLRFLVCWKTAPTTDLPFVVFLIIPEPYKGKGVRYADEQVKRKEAKKAAGAGAA